MRCVCRKEREKRKRSRKRSAAGCARGCEVGTPRCSGRWSSHARVARRPAASTARCFSRSLARADVGFAGGAHLVHAAGAGRSVPAGPLEAVDLPAQTLDLRVPAPVDLREVPAELGQALLDARERAAACLARPAKDRDRTFRDVAPLTQKSRGTSRSFAGWSARPGDDVRVVMQSI